MMEKLFTRERLLIFIRHLKGLLRELEKMVEEIDATK